MVRAKSAIVILTLALTLAACGGGDDDVARATTVPDSASGPYDVERVVDGDTVRLTNGDSVRLIGIDTPETVDPRKPVQCFGEEASEYARDLLDGESVYLELDPTQGDLDRYGRVLAYVWLPDGRHVNEEMVAQGYAHEYTYELPYRYQDEFQAAEAEARDADRGLWSLNTCAGVTE